MFCLKKNCTSMNLCVCVCVCVEFFLKRTCFLTSWVFGTSLRLDRGKYDSWFIIINNLHRVIKFFCLIWFFATYSFLLYIFIDLIIIFLSYIHIYTLWTLWKQFTERKFNFSVQFTIYWSEFIVAIESGSSIYRL